MVQQVAEALQEAPREGQQVAHKLEAAAHKPAEGQAHRHQRPRQARHWMLSGLQ